MEAESVQNQSNFRMKAVPEQSNKGIEMGACSTSQKPVFRPWRRPSPNANNVETGAMGESDSSKDAQVDHTVDFSQSESKIDPPQVENKPTLKGSLSRAPSRTESTAIPREQETVPVYRLITLKGCVARRQMVIFKDDGCNINVVFCKFCKSEWPRITNKERKKRCSKTQTNPSRNRP